MPNIPTLEAPNLGLTPSETGVESTARAAYRIGSYGNQEASDLQRVGQEIGGAVKSVGDVALQYMEHREINSAAPHAATLVAAKDQSWNNFITGKDIDPNDPNRQDIINARINNPQAAQQWREQNLDPDLDNFVGAFNTKGGQEWAEHWADTYRQHFTTKAMADQSSMAGAVVQANIEKTADTMATAVFNDPSTLSQSFDLLSHSIEGNVRSSPVLSPDVATRAQTELLQKNEEKLVQAAVQGAIMKGGDWRSIAQNPKYAPYIKPAENAQFERMEEFYQRGAVAAEKQSILLDKQIAEANAHTALNNSWAANVKIDPATGRPTINPQFFKDMVELPLRNPKAPNAAELARTYLDWGEGVQNGKLEKVTTDPTTAASLTTRMFDPDSPTTEVDIRKAQVDRKLSSADAEPMIELTKALKEGQVNDPVFKDTIDAVKSELILSNVGLPGKDIVGEGNFAKWAQTFIPQYLSQKRSGTLPPNALDVNDPKSLISQSMAPFKRSIAQRAQDYLSVLGGINQSALPTIANKAQYDALKSGDTYIGSDGKTYRKP